LVDRLLRDRSHAIGVVDTGDVNAARVSSRKCKGNARSPSARHLRHSAGERPKANARWSIGRAKAARKAAASPGFHRAQSFPIV
jgi:hypothetical protein